MWPDMAETAVHGCLRFPAAMVFEHAQNDGHTEVLMLACVQLAFSPF